MRFLAAVLCLLILAPLGAAPVAAQSFSPAQRQELDQIIHDYLQKHPEAIMGSIKALQEKEEAEKAERQRKEIIARRSELLADPDSAVGGNPKGDVTLVEFFDYRCPYCKQIEPALDALIKEDGDLRVVYKEFPILGPVSVVASHVAIAARKQGKYGVFHRAMMALKGTIDEQAVMKVAAACGLDMKRLKTDMNAPEVTAIIKRNYALAEALGIDGTPGLVVGDNLTMGAVDFDGLREMIAAARKKKN
jgi:protein-disulfide isomerase